MSAMIAVYVSMLSLARKLIRNFKYDETDTVLKMLRDSLLKEYPLPAIDPVEKIVYRDNPNGPVTYRYQVADRHWVGLVHPNFEAPLEATLSWLISEPNGKAGKIDTIKTLRNAAGMTNYYNTSTGNYDKKSVMNLKDAKYLVEAFFPHRLN